jgi:hypothetical protein
MAQSETAQGGGFTYRFDDAGGADWCSESSAGDTAPGPLAEDPDPAPLREYRHSSAPARGEPVGSEGSADFGITAWTPYRRAWYRKSRVIAVTGAVVALAVVAVVLMVGRDGRAAGDEPDVARAASTNSSPAPTAAPPHSAGTPQTALLPPAPPPPPPPTAEQMTPPPIVTRQWPRYEPPSQTKPAAPTVSSPPSMSFAPKPVTPPQTAAPGQNRGGHHGFF